MADSSDVVLTVLNASKVYIYSHQKSLCKNGFACMCVKFDVQLQI